MRRRDLGWCSVLVDSTDDDAVSALEQLMQRQVGATRPWTPVTDYSREARRRIEGPHPHLIRTVLSPQSVLNVGCGPGYLDDWLREEGLTVTGIDLHPPARAHFWRQDLCDPRPVIEWTLPFLTWDLVMCREVLEHLPLCQILMAVRNLVALSNRLLYITTRFAHAPSHLLRVDDHDDLDPTHITMLTKPFLRALFVLHGCRSRPDLEAAMDWRGLGRVLVFEVPPQ